MWALVNVPDGCLIEFDDSEIAMAALWEGDPVTFCNALRNVTAPWIDEDGMIHNWPEYAGKLLAYRDRKREQVRTRVAEHRQRQRSNAECNALRNAPVTPDRTVPYRTDHNVDLEENHPKVTTLTEDIPKKNGRFHRPTECEILDYFNDNGGSQREAQKFEAYYEANGWHVGKNCMKSWRAAAKGWILRAGEQAKPGGRTMQDMLEQTMREMED
jgi:hypothetical protein